MFTLSPLCTRFDSLKLTSLLYSEYSNFIKYTAKSDNRRFYNTLYEKIDKNACELSSTIDATELTSVLKSFISSKYDSKTLTRLFSKSHEDFKEKINLEDYLIILQLCNKLNLTQLDLVSSLSVNLTHLLSKLLKTDHNNKKDAVLAICKLYNDLKILYDPLFLTISDHFSTNLDGFSWNELSLLLKTYSNQRYNEVEILNSIVKRINNDLPNIDPKIATSLYISLANLEYLSQDLKGKLESVFMSSGDLFKEDLKFEELINVAYSNLLLDAPTVNDLQLVLSCLNGISCIEDVGDLSNNILRTFTVIVSYMKCIHKDLYNTLTEETRGKIMELLLQYNETKKFETSNFTEKVSEHLKRMRIRCEVNVYKNGVLLDILEQDQNLVWLCNSYHRFYATTFNMTANSKLLTKLIKAFGYKVSTINYYQWGRMKCKRTRFSFLRMARYYALKDKREYDPKYAGWSLPYIWWNYNGRDRLHISHYDHANP